MNHLLLILFTNLVNERLYLSFSGDPEDSLTLRLLYSLFKMST